MKSNNGIKIFQGLPPVARGIIAVGIVAGIAYVSYKVYKGIKASKEMKGAREEIGSADDASKTLSTIQKPTLDSYNLSRIANQLFTAMDGYGHNTSAIYKGFADVKNDLDVVNLVKAYGIREISSGKLNPEPNFKGTLGQALTNELTNEELKQLNLLLSRKGIKYRF